MYETRIRKVREVLSTKGFDALLVSIEENRRYLSGFTGEDHQFDESAGALLITADQLILTTDSRFESQAAAESPLFEVVVYRKGLPKELPSLVERLKIRKLAVESARISVHQYKAFQKELNAAGPGVELVPTMDLVEQFRLIKSSDEIDQTLKALELAETAFSDVVRTLRSGMTEKQIAWSLESALRQAGADGLSFPVIVASGPNSALPHAIPTERPVSPGEPILFDWGVRLGGYCSDTSRTVILGEPDQDFLQVFDTVLEAQQLAIATIRAGVNSKAVDAVARDYIGSKGYGDKFGHGLGHGTGLAIHEGPRLSPLKETVLETGMLVTVEPGIYLPHWGGVRIENQVVVRENGPQVLNRLPTTFEIHRF
ncbi:MAG: Xaa-Pro peptidase family protein [Desulfobacteraceae bacterium]|jgi:Xaa-Pro aminopeptidase